MKSLVLSAGKYHLWLAFLYLSLLVLYFTFKNEYLLFCGGCLLIFSASFLFSFISSKWLLIFLAVVIPFSIQTDIGSSGINLFFPSELLTGIFAGTILIKMLSWKIIDRQFLFHPVTMLILLYFILIVVTGAFSSMPLVTFKSVFVKGVYFLVFYFLVYDAVKNEQMKYMLLFILCYGIALVPVIIHSLTFDSTWGFGKKAADLASLPFYRDHTIYSACVAFIIPAIGFAAINSFQKKNILEFIFWGMVTILFFVTLFFSFSRAAWISVFAAFIYLIVLLLKIRPIILIILSILFATHYWQHADRFWTTAKENKYDSNLRNADIETQTKSIGNISTDQSNAERLNRWKCALRMFSKKPYTGFGSGTYMFQYFSFQREADMTPISVTSPYNTIPGHGGSVHSEYLLVLSENGIFAFIVFMLLILKILFTGMQNAYNHPEKEKRKQATVLSLVLLTYLVHGFFNNFLDTDKAAFLFWSSVCMLVVIDLSRTEASAKQVKKI
jgi:putative inorganic carbon (HCO3(-)) transporter